MNSPVAQPAITVRVFTRRFPATRHGAHSARPVAVEQLCRWGVAAEPMDRAELIVAELAANAVLHGRLPGRGFRLTLASTPALTPGRAEALRVAVTDPRGERLPVLPGTDTGDECGRGLLVVEALADRWGVEWGPYPLKTVWAELDTTPA